MDPRLTAQPDSTGDSAAAAPSPIIRMLDRSTGEITVTRGDQTETLTLLALPDLYGSGNGGQTADPQNDIFMPLFLSIEEAIAQFDASEQRLNDAAVSLALNQLSMNPDAPSADPLIRQVQVALRLTLSVNN